MGFAALRVHRRASAVIARGPDAAEFPALTGPGQLQRFVVAAKPAAPRGCNTGRHHRGTPGHPGQRRACPSGRQPSGQGPSDGQPRALRQHPKQTRRSAQGLEHGRGPTPDGLRPQHHRHRRRGTHVGCRKAGQAPPVKGGELQSTRLKTKVPLVPPKPKLFFTATSIFISRAVLAQ